MGIYGVRMNKKESTQIGKLINKVDNMHVDVKEIKTEVKENTRFRYTAKATVRVFTWLLGGGTLTSLFLWILMRGGK